MPLYFAAERPTVERDGAVLMVDDERLPLEPGEKPAMRTVRFRTLGCYPLTGAVESDAATLRGSSQEMLLTTTSRAPGPRDRPRSGALDGEEEAGGLFLMAHASRALIAQTSTPTCARQRAQVAAALHHLRQRRRRQVDADRPAALRLQDDLRRPARGARGRQQAGRHAGRAIDFALLVDGLAAEREQGITIDVAYRFFATDKRKFIVADTPGTSNTRATWSPAPRPPTWP